MAKSIDPENNPPKSKHNQKIVSRIENNQITYTFENFERIATLRLTLEDLLNHLSLSKDISMNIESTIDGGDKEKE